MSTNYISRVMLQDLSHPAMGEETIGLVIDRLFSMIERLERRVTELEIGKPFEPDNKVTLESRLSDIEGQLETLDTRVDDLEGKIDDKIDKYDFKNEVEDVIRDLSFSVSID